MPTVDLSSPTPPPDSLLAGLPRRVTLTLPELRLLAERTGGAPLPFLESATSDAPATDGGGLESRLGAPGGGDAEAAFTAAVAGLHDPVESLTRRGLLEADGSPEAGLAGAVGLLATPRVALDLDVAVGRVRAHAWHRHGRAAVAALATADGLVFELGWFAVGQWAGELARVAAVPEDAASAPGAPDDRTRTSALPDVLDLPYELLDSAGEAFRTRRSDVVGVLAAHHTGEVIADGRPVADAQVPGLLGALAAETRGRLRALVCEVPAETVGVTSWLLVADGWRALRPHTTGGVARVELRRVDPDDLAACLAPVLAEVVR